MMARRLRGEKITVDVSTRLGITRRPISDTEIRERLLYPMVNEGARIPEEGIAIRASDIDVIWIHGYGWPVYRGGPMFWADFDQRLPALRNRMLEHSTESRATVLSARARSWVASPRADQNRSEHATSYLSPRRTPLHQRISRRARHGAVCRPVRVDFAL
jgi:hypothetical protein